MAKKVLITDTLYMFQEHEDRIRAAGYDVVRFPEPAATEEQLCELLAGVSGYVLGGIELVTESAVEAADQLEGVAFCGAGWTEWIIAHDALTRRGIPITTTAGSNADSVAEYAIALVTTALRQLPLIASTSLGVAVENPTRFLSPSPHEFRSLHACVVGIGHIGSRVTTLLRALGFKVETVHREDAQAAGGAGLRQALGSADVVVVCVNKAHGEGVLGDAELRAIKDGALVVNPVFANAIDDDAMFSELKAGRLRAAYDGPPSFDLSDLDPGAIICSNAQAAYNTVEALQRTSDWATESILNMLSGKTDPRIVNDEYRSFR